MLPRLLSVLGLALAIPTLARAEPARVLDGPRAVDGATLAIVVEVPSAGSALAETYVLLLERRHGGMVPVGAVLIGLGAVVDRLDLGAASLDVAFREHFPVDVPGQPSRSRVRAFPLHVAVTTPDWATSAAITAPAWAAAADLAPAQP